MIKCNSCNEMIAYSGKICPICSSPISMTDEDVLNIRKRLSAAEDSGNTADIYECRHFLADHGETKDIREYAKLLEKGDHQLRDMDGAMNYYRLAAERDDPYSAYRYSKLSGRRSEDQRRFWLKYAALLGAVESYPELAELLSEEGREDIAAYYSSLAAECHDTDSIVDMAKRWNDGIGVEASCEYAKWYLDKLTLPPISAIKLAYKLRSVRASAAPKLEFPDYRKYLQDLSREAQRLLAMSAYFRIGTMLSDMGDLNAMTVTGVLLAEGKGVCRDTERAKRVLDTAVSGGNAAAAVYLAECFAEGRCFERNGDLAIEYYKKAAYLGFTDANESLGDIYNAGELAEKDLKLATQYYELATGNESAKKKAEAIKAKRREFYERGKGIALSERPTAEERFDAFRSVAIATAMGEGSAPKLLADFYRAGFGTKKDRSLAFYWYRAAYDEGDGEALLPLALCYARGEGVAFSYKLAIRYLKLAEERGSRAASEALDLILRRRMKKMIRSLYASAMELIHMKKYEEAFSILLKMAPLKYPKALYTLGCLYEFGVGAERSDRIIAAKYYDLALKGNENYKKFSDPMSKYKLKILKMIR
ncbi:MAG: sel1 repeat family protein [Clostridia bacterium]|nr:sel1 repeat family protein [Clostridia bacterium]